MVRAMTQMMLLPLTAMLAGSDLLGRALRGTQGWAEQGFDSLVSRWVQSAVQVPAPGPAAALAPVPPMDGPGLERSKTDLDDDEVKLVRYTLLSVNREAERILESGEEIVTGALGRGGFESWVVGRYSRGHALPADDHRFLRVHFEVLTRYGREPFRHAERQVAVLEEIRDAIRREPAGAH